MVRYIKDGAYTIIVEDVVSPSKDETTGEGLDGVDDLSTRRDEESLKEIDFTSVDFILQNLQLAKPSYEEDKTFMMTGRKDLVEIICSQVCFYVYCAMIGLETKLTPISILVIGDGFVGSNVIASLVSAGCTAMLRVFTRSDSSAAEWAAKGIKSNSSVMELLAGQRPDIIIPCVENASFVSICKQLTENGIVTELSFIIAPTFGFQRRKLFNNLKCSNIFRTFTEPHRIVRRYRSKSLARRMEILSLLTGQDLPPTEQLLDSQPPQSNSSPPAAGGRKSRGANPLGRSVMWGGDIPDDQALQEEPGALSTALQSITEDLPDLLLATDETLDAAAAVALQATGEEALCVDEQGAALLRERMRDLSNLVFLLENYYFQHGMLHHEARRSALDCIFGFHEAAASSTSTQQQLGLPEDTSINPGSSIGQQRGVTPSRPTSALSRHGTPDQNNRPHHHHHHHHGHHHHHHVHHVYRHNILRRSKAAARVRHALERAIDQLYAAHSRHYHTEFMREAAESELLEMLHYYPPDHQLQLDRASFEANRVSMQQLSVDGSSGGASRSHHQLTKADKHRSQMYDEDFLLELFGEDDDYAHREGPGFDYMRQMDDLARRDGNRAEVNTPKYASDSGANSRPGTKGGSAEEAANEDIDSLVRLLELAKERSGEGAASITMNASSAVGISGTLSAGSAAGTSDGAPVSGSSSETMGKRIFRKHSMFANNLHSKVTGDVLDDDLGASIADYSEVA